MDLILKNLEEENWNLSKQLASDQREHVRRQNEKSEIMRQNFNNKYKTFQIDEIRKLEEEERKKEQETKKRARKNRWLGMAKGAAVAAITGGALGSAASAIAGGKDLSSKSPLDERSSSLAKMISDAKEQKESHESLPGMGLLGKMVDTSPSFLKQFGKDALSGLMGYGKDVIGSKMQLIKKQGADNFLGIERSNEELLPEYMYADQIEAEKERLAQKRINDQLAHERAMEMADLKEKNNLAKEEFLLDKKFGHEKELISLKNRFEGSSNRHGGEISSKTKRGKFLVDKDLKMMAENFDEARDMAKNVDEIIKQLNSKQGKEFLDRYKTDSTLLNESHSGGLVDGPLDWARRHVKSIKNSSAPTGYNDFVARMKTLEAKGIDISMSMSESTPRTNEGMAQVRKQLLPDGQVTPKVYANKLASWRKSLINNAKNMKKIASEHGRAEFLDDGDEAFDENEE